MPRPLAVFAALLLALPLVSHALNRTAFERDWPDARGGATAMQVAVIEEGGIVASLRHGTDGDARFRAGSITKLVTAVAVMQLVEDGRLRLSDDVLALAPELPIDATLAGGSVTVEQVLEHTAGFDEMRFARAHAAAADESTLEELRRFAPELRVRWRTGERHAYSNVGYGVLGYLVEKQSGLPYARYVEERIFAPLGMAASRIERASLAARLVQGHDSDGVAVPPVDTSLAAAGGLVTTADDLAQLVRLFATRGGSAPGVLTRASIERIETPRTTLAARHGLDFGYGLGNQASERLGVRLQGHDGGTAGFAGQLAYSPTGRYGYVVLVDRSDATPVRATGDAVLKALGVAREVSRPKGLGPIDPRYGGYYVDAAPRNGALALLERVTGASRVEVDGGELLLAGVFGGDERRYVRREGGLLQRVDRAQPSAVLVDPDGGRLVVGAEFLERGSFADVVLPGVAAVAAAVASLVALLWAPIWLCQLGFGRLRRDRLAGRQWLAACGLALALVVFGAMQLSLATLGLATPAALAIFVGTLAWPIAATLALVGAWRGRASRYVAAWVGANALLVLGVSLWLATGGLIGLRLWAA